MTSNDQETIWSYVRSARADYLKKIVPNYFAPNEICRMIIPEEDVRMNLNRTTSLLKLSNISNEIQNISKTTIIFGAKLYIYLNSCYKYQDFWTGFLDFKKEVSTIVLGTFKIISIDFSDDGTVIAKKFLKYLVSSVGFQFLKSVENEKDEGFSITRNIANIKG